MPVPSRCHCSPLPAAASPGGFAAPETVGLFLAAFPAAALRVPAALREGPREQETAPAPLPLRAPGPPLQPGLPPEPCPRPTPWHGTDGCSALCAGKEEKEENNFDSLKMEASVCARSCACARVSAHRCERAGVYVYVCMCVPTAECAHLWARECEHKCVQPFVRLCVCRTVSAHM